MLDSHAMLWALLDDPRLGSRARLLIDDPRTTVVVSALSVWEIGIKRKLGKLPPDPDLAASITDAGYTPLVITVDHAVAAGRLPLHHRDPFDRMLVAQAQMEGLTIVTRDPKIGRYDVPVLWD